jgi:L-lactate dehydrogenase
MAIALRGRARELVLVDRTERRSKAIATDMRYGTPIAPVTDVRAGDYDDLSRAAVVIIAAGVNEKAGGATDLSDPLGRLRLLGPNVKVFQEIVPQIVRGAPDAVILVLTDPPDPLVDVTRRLAGHDRVLSTSTYLDSLRFRVHLADRLGVSPASVDAYVVGEHGTSSVFLWSSARIGSMSVQDLLAQRKIAFDDFRKALEADVRYANISIIEGIGASQYGVGMVGARVAEAILRDERAVFPVGSHNPQYGVTLSLPSVVGRNGVSEILRPTMSNAELRALEHGVEVLRNAMAQYVGST